MARGKPDGGGVRRRAANPVPPLGMLSRCSPTSERNHLARVRFDLGAVRGPGVHQLAAFVEQIATPVGGLDRIGDGVCENTSPMSTADTGSLPTTGLT
jgi:hypothetical protein